MTHLAHLETPIVLGSVTLKNRLVMGALTTGLEGSRRRLARLADFYAERARHGVGLIVTGGVAPAVSGLATSRGGAPIPHRWIVRYRCLPVAVHPYGCRICLQLVLRSHADSGTPARWWDRRARDRALRRQAEDIGRAAARARDVGFDGVEVVGGAGPWDDQSTVRGGRGERPAMEGGWELDVDLAVVDALRRRAGRDCLLLYRLPSRDLVEEGAAGEKVLARAARLVAAGVDALVTDEGWWGAKAPRAAGDVPREASAGAARRLKEAVSRPVIATGCAGDLSAAEALIAEGWADMVSMARPLLADPALYAKARRGQTDQIVPCIDCNQACLSPLMEGGTISCTVNPGAGDERHWRSRVPRRIYRVAVVGAGPAGLVAALRAAERGHDVTLFEGAGRLGGQFELARRIPGKEGYGAFVRSIEAQLSRLSVEIHLSTWIEADDVMGEDFDEILLATGVRPRVPALPGIDLPLVMDYREAILAPGAVGSRVALIGAGAIGWDVAHLLARTGGMDPAGAEGGSLACSSGPTPAHRGGVRPGGPASDTPGRAARRITILQRSPDRPGGGRDRATRWGRRRRLELQGVELLGGVRYDRIDEEGVWIERGGRLDLVPADTVVLCAGVESRRELADPLRAWRRRVSLVGGAARAECLDAARAIREATLWGLSV